VVGAVTGAGDGAELLALLALERLPGVGPASVHRLLSRFGTARGALAAPARLLRATVRGGSFGRSDLRSACRDAERILAQARSCGLTVIGRGDGAYPAGLLHLADPPPVLFTRGRTELLEAESVTIVGARRATARARDLAERLAAAVARSGRPVVSGMALGIDAAAHRGALSAAGPTIAVLGTGADVPYPRSQARLYREIVARGLVVSELSPGTPALPHHFPRRNRVLAALGRATVVVEAGARSGALITVDHALDLGRDVWAVPGPIERPGSEGSNRLLAEGARPLLSIAHFLSDLAPEQVGGGGASPTAGEVVGGGPHHRRDDRPGWPVAGGEGERVGGDDPAARVVALLAEGPHSGDDVAELLGLPAHEALALLTELELRGAVRRLPGLRFGVAA